MPRGKNPPSGQFGPGQNQPHIGASRSQSGQPQRSQTPRPQRGNGGGGTRNPLAGNPLAMGYNPTRNPLDFSHGGTKKKRNKGQGSR